MKMGEMFPGRYLKGTDIVGSPTYKIASISQEEVGQDREQKFVVYFEEVQKGVVLNKTNGELLGMLYGDESDDWVGESVMLYTQPVVFNGRTTNAIRFRAPKKSQKQQTAEIAADLNDEVPDFGANY